MSKIIEKILNDPRVEDISDERVYARTPPGYDENGDGFWVYTAAGYCVESGPTHDEGSCLHAIHENSPTECWQRMREIQPCDCQRCAPTTTTGDTTR